METLDGFILNLFRTEKPTLSTKDFENNTVWVCDLLNQDIDLANEFVKFKLSRCSDKLEKLHFLYSSRTCFIYTIDELKNNLDPDYKSEYGNYYKENLTKAEMIKRLKRYQKALKMTNQAICYYIDCSSVGCGDNQKFSFQITGKKGAKTDLIRVFNAMYELKFFVTKEGQIPSKEMFMKRCGDFFGIDLSKYETDLSQALNETSLEANIKIFEQLKEVTQNTHYLGKKNK